MLLDLGDLAQEEHRVAVLGDDSSHERTIGGEHRREGHRFEPDADRGDSRSLAALLVELGIGLVLDHVDVHGSIGHAGEVGAGAAGFLHAEALQSLDEVGVVVDLEARDAQQNFLLAPGLHSQKLLSGEVGDESVDVGAISRKEQIEAHLAVLAERQRNGGVGGVANVADALLVVHERNGRSGAGEVGEGAVEGLVLVELARPGTLEVDGVEQEHHHVGRNVLDDGRDLALGLVARPGVDGVLGGGVGEVGGGHLRIEVVGDGLDEVGLEGHGLLGPDGVGDVEFDAGVLGGQRVEQRLERGIDDIDAVRLVVAQSGLHAGKSGVASAVHGHGERDGDRSRRQQNALALVGGGSDFLLEQAQSEIEGRIVRRRIGHLRISFRLCFTRLERK